MGSYITTAVSRKTWVETLKHWWKSFWWFISNHETTTPSISFPDEIIQDILSRLPTESLLRFTSVSKQWQSLISDDPSFRKLYFSRSLVTNDRTSFFISSYDTSTNERHFLSAPHDGGPVTHIITLRNAPNYDAHGENTEAEHLNGLVFFTSRNPFFYGNYAFVVNPATRKVFKVPPPFDNKLCKYFFGFDESNAEHKILSISKTGAFMIFSLSTYSWKEIHVDLEQLPPVSDMIQRIKHSVCVNSVIHLMLNTRYELLGFDLTAEKFSIMNLPQGAIPHKLATCFSRQGKLIFKVNMPILIKYKELLGVICHDQVVETKKMDIWILQDYVNRVWVKETVTSSEYWLELDGLQIKEIHDMGEHVFSCRRLSRDMVDTVILDMETKSFKLVNFNLGYQFLHSKTVNFHLVRSYVESILPLREECAMELMMR